MTCDVSPVAMFYLWATSRFSIMSQLSQYNNEYFPKIQTPATRSKIWNNKNQLDLQRCMKLGHNSRCANAQSVSTTLPIFHFPCLMFDRMQGLSSIIRRFPPIFPRVSHLSNFLQLNICICIFIRICICICICFNLPSIICRFSSISPRVLHLSNLYATRYSINNPKLQKLNASAQEEDAKKG